jgi:type I restriction enzyme M protein
MRDEEHRTAANGAASDDLADRQCAAWKYRWLGVQVLRVARLVPNADLLANDVNIAVSFYIEKEATPEAVDTIVLNAEIAHIVAR